MRKNITAIALLALITVATSCNREGCTDESALNFDSKAKTDDGSCTYENAALNVPSEYVFTDSQGNTTVSFKGQTQRQLMLTEIVDLLKSENTPGVAIDSQVLKNMYANEGVTWQDPYDLDLNESTKNLKSKTAASAGSADPVWQAYYEDLFDEIGAISAATTSSEFTGGPGVAGVVQSTTNPEKAYLMNANGREITQLVEKGLMGSVFYNQCTLWYLSDDEINVDNSTAVDIDDEKFYTEMEHHWDEAYGYLTDGYDYPNDGIDDYWGKYTFGRNDLIFSADNLSLAFRTGRAAITANDLSTRDGNITIILDEFAKASAGTAIHYLNGALSDLTDNALRNHQLSEAWAFIDALRFGKMNGFTGNTVDGWLDTIGTNFYEVTAADLNTVKAEIANQFNLSGIADAL
ncbi:MAG: hypothetical protein ACI9RU_000232 [Litorivivens sp.]|jgi:hypothetical protein